MKILYLTTNYPWMSHTFIQREILGVERRGWTVLPMALNAPLDGEMLSEIDHAEQARTSYVKAVDRGHLVRLLGSAVVRHPGAVTRGAVRAIRTAGGDPRLVLKHLFQFVEAIVVWAYGERAGARAVHAHFGQAPATVAWFAAAFGNDVAPDSWSWSVTVHGWHEFVSEEASLLRHKVAAAAFVACISDFTRSQLMRISDSEHWHKLEVVRCGIDPDEFDLRRPVGTSSTPTVVTTARLSAEKGHIVLLGALAALRDRGLPVRALLIGDGALRTELEAAAADLGLADTVEFVGAIPPTEVAETLRRADVFCLPSFAEGLPVSIMEAMAIGVPVVTTYISGVPELVVDGETGWVVPAGSVDQLADALADALSAESRDRVIEAARAAVVERHDLEASVGRLAELFDRHHARDSAPAVAVGSAR